MIKNEGLACIKERVKTTSSSATLYYLKSNAPINAQIFKQYDIGDYNVEAKSCLVFMGTHFPFYKSIQYFCVKFFFLVIYCYLLCSFVYLNPSTLWHGRILQANQIAEKKNTSFEDLFLIDVHHTSQHTPSLFVVSVKD